MLVGDNGVGKTCMLIRYAKHMFSSIYIPLMIENSVHDETVDDMPIEVSLFDTRVGEILSIASQASFSKLPQIPALLSRIVISNKCSKTEKMTLNSMPYSCHHPNCFFQNVWKAMFVIHKLVNIPVGYFMHISFA